MSNSVRAREDFKEFALFMRGPAFLSAIDNSPMGSDAQGFVMSCERAVEKKPSLLSVDDISSLLSAMIECAGYGFYADSDEGYFEDLNNKISDGKYQRIARYELQLAGIRAVAARHDVFINANVVHEADFFEHEEGDSPQIYHKIDHREPRGEPFLVYAIFKHRDGTIIHREVMTKEEIEAVKSKSRNQSGELWGKFWTEGWKKSVVRRGSKTVKLASEVNKAVRQIDRDYNFGKSDEVNSPIQEEPKTDDKPASKKAAAKKAPAKKATSKKAEDSKHKAEDTPADEILPEEGDGNVIEAEATEVKPDKPAPRRRRRRGEKAEENVTNPPEPDPEPEPEPEPDWEAMTDAEADEAWEDLEEKIDQATTEEELNILYKHNKGFIEKFDEPDDKSYFVGLMKTKKASLKA